MSYEETIKSFSPLSINDIIETAKKYVPSEYQNKPWAHPALNHGTALLQNNEQMSCYLAAYGEMHKSKMDGALQKFPFKQIDENFEIIDWACGQGLASVCTVDFLRQVGLLDKLQKITLIEPSPTTLARAELNVRQSVENKVQIVPLNLYLPSNSSKPDEKYISELHIDEPICIHLFSNILDIFSVNLKDLSRLTCSSGYRHFFVCVSPLYSNNERLTSFTRYFNLQPDNFFVDFAIGYYKELPNGHKYSCAAKGFQLTREEGKTILTPLSFYPPKQFHAAFRLDAIEELDKQKKLCDWNKLSAFEVLAPFDFGASVYDDIDPILAVLSNIVTRGLPTKCSPFIEEKLNDAFNFSTKTKKYGTIHYDLKQDAELPDEQLLRDIPIAIARIEKVIIEAVLTGHISILKNEWNVLVKENDVPCSALAFADLAEMYNHLTALSSTFSDRNFPKVNLTIISENFTSSPLHLNSTVHSHVKNSVANQTYDMVIDFAIRENVDAANVRFSEFKANNNCYFNVRSSNVVYTIRDVYTTDRIIYQPLTKANENGRHVEEEKNVNHLIYFLRLLFRKEQFRPGQLPILNRALQVQGVIGLLPTGGGKSLTYQLAAMLQPGITVIIDPLKSLMQDQYDGLINTGIDCCTYINSELTTGERASHETMMEFSKVIFAFISPERLCIYEFRERLQNMKNLHVYFSYGVIDEVHCVSEWGQDFRFSYLHLGRNLYSYVNAKDGRISLFGLTATASFDVLSDVERELSGNGAFSLDPDTVVRFENSNRLELQYKIEKVEVTYNDDKSYKQVGTLINYPKAVNIGDVWSTNNQKGDFLANYIQKIPGYIRQLQSKESIQRILSRFQERENLEDVDGKKLLVDMPDDFYATKDDYQQAGIVFCPHVNTTGVSVSKNSATLSHLCKIGTFSGSAQEGAKQGNESMENMKKFRDNKLPIMVATKAFGMGIDKPNVRFTINMNYSNSLESFVQEAGRAGRDRKMALSVILVSDYNLVRINPKFPHDNIFPLYLIIGKWFKDDVLFNILRNHNISIDPSYFDYCNPLSDIVKLKCSNRSACRYNNHCNKFDQCPVRRVDMSMTGWQFRKDLDDYLAANNIRIPKENFEYQGADYNTVMYFFDNNFKGEFEEKKKMLYLMSEKNVEYFIGNNKKDKPANHIKAKGFLETVLNSEVGTDVVTIIPYEDKKGKGEDDYADTAKAIYRMCMIGLIDDFTQDYANSSFRIVSKRKKDGAYYDRLKDFLMRYYSEERAQNEVAKAKERKGDNEIHKCLGYLTEFVYDKVAIKRKRAIDDIRNFCNIGVDTSSGKNWLEINEDLKDEIYYYFNSRFAREGYTTDNNEPFSLLDDTDRGKISSHDILLKYMRVVDADVMGVSGSPKDSIKHLQGAVRLIRRSIADINATLSLLNAYCLIALKIDKNEHLIQELDKSYIEGYQALRNDTPDYDTFLSYIEQFKEGLNSNGRNLASQDDIQHLNYLDLITELEIHDSWIDKFASSYTE